MTWMSQASQRAMWTFVVEQRAGYGRCADKQVPAGTSFVSASASGLSGFSPQNPTSAR
jgi:hypothetical protein